MNRLISTVLLLMLACSTQLLAATQRWPEEKANAWYQQQPWLVGSNFIPASAINELAMWQADTFDPPEIDKELGWAQSLGMNTMRVSARFAVAAGCRRLPATDRYLSDHRGQA